VELFNVITPYDILIKHTSVCSLQPQGTSVWLGATDLASEGDWVWQGSGTDMVYEKFYPGEPNGGMAENCLIMMYENGNWIDGQCSGTMNYHICEIPTVKPAPPVIKTGNISFYWVLICYFFKINQIISFIKY